MQENKKPPNIHVNPIFTENTKPSIHINPKVHINTAIHINPRMVSVFKSTGPPQQHLPEAPRLQKKSFTKINNQGNDKQEMKNIQKSIYVNPKLMEKLKNNPPDVKNFKDDRRRIQPKNSFVINKLNSLKYIKKSPTNLIALSRQKLIRIQPSNPENIEKIDDFKMTNNNNSNGKLKIVNLPQKRVDDELKKATATSHQLKRINPVNLKKINNKASPKCSKNSENKYKIDRTGREKKVRAQVSRKTMGTKNNLINIDGVLYRSSKSCLVKSANNSPGKTKTAGIKKPNFNNSRTKKLRKHVVVNGKIRRINTNNLSKTYFSNLGQKSNYKHVISNRVKQRSLQILRHKICKNNQPCLLFQRFGYCAKHMEGTCPKVHDKKQVALCKNFLQGTCLLDNCPLSHDVGPEKMPTCKYFLEGCCVRDKCQYLHVKVSANTPICVPFLRGYCAKGDQCKERHTNICPEFEKNGKCQKGKNCPYPHKSCLLQQQNHLKLPTTRYNQKSTDKSVVISSNDDKKRYYDDDLEVKKCNISKKIRIMTMVHQASKGNDVGITDNVDEMKSQPINDDLRPKRPPIGPLPSYIPIN